MANELATLGRPEFVAQRVTQRNTKNGPVEVVKSRGLLGVITSGNKAEHVAGSVELAAQLWLEHKYTQIVSEYRRVFPTLEKTIEARNTAVEAFKVENPEAKVSIVDFNKLTKASTLAIISVAVRMIDPEKAVGERAVYYKIGQGIVAAEKALQEMLKARQEALAAPVAA